MQPLTQPKIPQDKFRTLVDIAIKYGLKEVSFKVGGEPYKFYLFSGNIHFSDFPKELHNRIVTIGK